MSANLVVDLGNTCVFPPSIASVAGVGNVPASGAIVGNIVDLKDANTYTNVWCAGQPNSGILVLKVESADTGSGLLQSGGGFPISGAFVDPTSGMVDFPGIVKSGGLIYINSGFVAIPGGGGLSGAMNVNTFQQGTNPVFNAQTGAGFAPSGNFPVFASGGMAMAGVQMGRYGRLVALSGGYTGQIIAGFMKQLRTTGSGGGFTMAPQTGTVNV